jgi:hypothetical protein
MTHGTYSTYQAGCTCEDCTEAAADHELLTKPRPQRNHLGQYQSPISCDCRQWECWTCINRQRMRLYRQFRRDNRVEEASRA